MRITALQLAHARCMAETGMYIYSMLQSPDLLICIAFPTHARVGAAAHL